MSNLEYIELGAGELLITKHYNRAGRPAIFWDATYTAWEVYPPPVTDFYWPAEYQVASAIDAELEAGKVEKDIEIGKVKAAIKSAVIGAQGTFKIKVSDSSLENILIAVGADPRDMLTDAISEKYSFYSSGKDEFFTLRYTIPRLDDANKKDMIELYKVLPQGLAPLPFAKGDERSFEINFKCLGVAVAYDSPVSAASWSIGQFFRFK